MSDCDTIKAKLPALLRQALTSNEIHAVRTHLGRCSACRIHLGKLSPDNEEGAPLTSLTLHSQKWVALVIAVALTSLIGAYIAITGHGLVTFLQDPDEPLFLRIVTVALVSAVSVLFAIIYLVTYDK